MIPVVLSGGSGTRLWPVSRENYPKQFCDFYDHSFLENSLTRLSPWGKPWVVTVGSMDHLTERAMRKLDIPTDQALYEPFGKNTAPAIALLCHRLDQAGKADEVAGVFPADHLVLRPEAFTAAVNLAVKVAADGVVTTLGIEPRRASTGYGYIEVTDEKMTSEGALKALKVRGFREKPDKPTAEKYTQTGHHFWNAGIFIFKVSTMIEAFKAHMPDMWKRVSGIKEDLSNLKHTYANLQSESIDYGIMEKLDQLACVPCEMGWSDVGSWDEIARLADEVPGLQRDINAKVFTVDAHGNYVFSIRNKVVGLVGVNNIIAVDTPDGLLITHKGQSEKVKELVGKIKAEGFQEASAHPFETRPWGKFEVLTDEAHFKCKRITVDPGQQLSYQSHKKRAEHWTIISGQAEVVLNDSTESLNPGQSIQIPQGAKHRMRNPGSEPLVFVEVQTGTYFGEDDIVRYQDDYNRV